MEHPIRPPAHKPTEQEHRIAYLTYCLNDIWYEYLLGVNMVRTGQLKDDLRKEIDGTTSLMEAELRCIDKMFAKWKDGDIEVWEAEYPYEKFKADQEEYLADEHAGDCTAIACPCVRCHAEDLYKIPSTVTWKGKQEGWKLFHEYRKLQEKSKDLPE